nr:MAG TPA: hypothetical protein [Caudoviricetes sp.]
MFVLFLLFIIPITHIANKFFPILLIKCSIPCHCTYT